MVNMEPLFGCFLIDAPRKRKREKWAKIQKNKNN